MLFKALSRCALLILFFCVFSVSSLHSTLAQPIDRLTLSHSAEHRRVTLSPSGLIIRLLREHCGQDGCSAEEIRRALNEARRQFPALSPERFIIEFILNKIGCFFCPDKIEAIHRLLESLANDVCSGQPGVANDGNFTPEEMQCLIDYIDDNDEDDVIEKVWEIIENLSALDQQALRDLLFPSMMEILRDCGYIFPLPATEEQIACIFDKLEDLLEDSFDYIKEALEEILDGWTNSDILPNPHHEDSYSFGESH